MYAENSWNATNLGKLLSIVLPADLPSYVGQKKWIGKYLFDPEIFQEYMDKPGNTRSFFNLLLSCKINIFMFWEVHALKKIKNVRVVTDNGFLSLLLLHIIIFYFIAVDYFYYTDCFAHVVREL